MAAKIDIRRKVLAELPQAHVFDAFCGDGGMYRGAWHSAASYIGCDLKFWPPAAGDTRRRFVADNALVMRAIDLQPFNVFDLDAFGSPWELMLILAARRKWQPGERGAVVLTDGTPLKLRFGSTPIAMRKLMGAKSGMSPPTGSSGDTAIDASIHGWLTLCSLKPLRMWQATGNGSTKGTLKMVYSSIVFERSSDSPAAGKSSRCE